MQKKRRIKLLLERAVAPTVIFAFAFWVVPINMLNGLGMMPGDIGDARLNNYFLENVVQFFAGNSDSLWNLSFFHPFPYVLGFSDNLFGSVPVYILARAFTDHTDLAYQVWFLFGYLANFIAAYYALRRLNGSILAASVGAVIFAFALPTTAHAGHAQLHYRFGLPLAIVFFAEFLNSKAWRFLLISAAWLVWQFYAGIYIGFFTLTLIAAMKLTYLGGQIYSKISMRDLVKEFFASWMMLGGRQKLIIFGGLFFLALLTLLLFYPYAQVTHLYGLKRTWDDIATMLPRPQSYFLSDASYLWSMRDAKIFSEIPMRHEHQMFVGAVPMLLAIAGFIFGSRERNGATFFMIGGMLGLTALLTLYSGKVSPWVLLHNLPLVSAIRAVTRFDQAFLFPIAYFAGIAIDRLRARWSWGSKVVVVLIAPVLVFEAGMTSMQTSSKEVWRQRLAVLDESLPENLPKNSILFFAQNSGPFYAAELDAMWVALKRGARTVNGYSGNSPPYYRLTFGKNCSELPGRVIAYLSFAKQSENVDAYRELAGQITPIGFDHCDPLWLSPPSSLEFSGGSLSDLPSQVGHVDGSSI